MNLTEKFAAKQQAGPQRTQFLDDAVRGFGLRVEPNGRKSFFWRAKINGEVVMRALGEFGDKAPCVSVAQARADAQELVGKAAWWKRNRFEGPSPFAKVKREEPVASRTFGELVEAYIDGRLRPKANRPEKAEKYIRWMVEKHFSAWVDKPLAEITPQHLLKIKHACGEHHVMANRCVEFCRTIFNWAGKSDDTKINFERIAVNPASVVSLHDEGDPRERFLQPAELVRFNAALQELQHRDLADFLTLAINTGCRKSDIFSMRYSDVSWERCVWRVAHPKSGHAYDVSLLPAALMVLERRRDEADDKEGFVFPGVGATGHLVDLRTQWLAFRSAAGVSDVRLHDIRRTVGSYLAIAGQSLQTIGKALGHRSTEATEIYAHLHDAAVRDAREAGQTKMVQMMALAEKRTKAAGRKQKLLKSA